jgi:hypothetical protein
MAQPPARPSVAAEVDGVRGAGRAPDPATRKVEREYVLDPNDPGELTAPVPRRFHPVALTESWKLFARCPAAGS